MIGKKLQSLRKSKGLTLQQVSAASGISAAFLSQVERELTSLSIASLASIARALEVNPSFFFPPPHSQGLSVPSYAREPFQMDNAEVVYARLGGDFHGRTLEPLFATYPPCYVGEELSHIGEEFYYVLSGQLVAVIGDDDHKLNQNDSIHFSSSDKHHIENRGEVPVHVVAVTTPTLLS